MIRKFAFCAALVAMLGLSMTPALVTETNAERPAGVLPILPLAKQAGLTTLYDLVKTAGLTSTLSKAGSWTVFAPTNEAFGKLDAATLNAVLSDKALLTDILLYHVAAGELLAADVLGKDSIEMANGDFVMVDAASVRVNESNIIATNIAASNGVVHLIDTVLIPPTDNAVRVLGPNFNFTGSAGSVQETTWGSLKSQYE